MVSIFKSLRMQRENSRARNELNNLSDRELADIGIFRGDIASVVKGHRRLN